MATWTPEQIDRMTGDEYKTLFNTNPEFVKFVNEMADVPVARKTTSEAAQASRDLATARSAAAAGFDPSFDEDPNVPKPAVAQVTVQEPVVAPVTPAVQAPAAAPVVPVVVETIAPVLKKFEIRYQPTDANGRPVGGEQVVKYEAETEIPQSHPAVQQLIKNHIAATVALRETRAKVLTSDTSVPENAVKAPVFTEFFVLSPEQKAALEAEAQDPTTGAAARAKLADSARNETLNKTQETLFTVQSQLALANFKANNPDFYRCNENAAALINYVVNKGLDPTDEQNLQTAYETLRDAGALYGRPVTNQPAAPALVTEAPIVREVKTAPSAEPVVASPRIGTDAQPQTPPAAPLPTGLSNSDVSTDGTPSEVQIESQLVWKKVYKDAAGKPTGVIETYVGIDALDHMPSDELRKAIENDIRLERSTGKGTGFRKTVDMLEELRAKRLRERRERNRR